MKGHVLIVDDNVNNLRIAVDILINEKLRLTTAKSGTEALKALERNNIDLILLDINMPEMDGFETIKKIRLLPDYEKIPVLFVTSYNDEEFLERGFQSGCVDFILKPFRPSEFIARINNHLALSLHQRHLKELVSEKTIQLEQTILELTKSKQAKDNFLGIMSHELRTPLNGILGMIELLKVPSLDEKKDEIVEDLETSAQRLTKLISSILDYSTLEEPHPSAQASVIDIPDFLTHVEYLASCREGNHNRYTVTVDENLPEKMAFDKKACLKILECLIDNAFKFSENDTIKIHLSFKPKTKEKATLIISIKDNGIGIPSDQTKLIFDKFYQVDSGINRHYEGAGIGLAIAQKLCNSTGSHISVESELTKGSTFTLHQEVKLNIKPTNHKRQQKLNEINVLIVEDVRTNQAFLAQILALRGIKSFVAKDHKECYYVLKNEKVDLILMDYTLPDKNGVEITRDIRSNGIIDKSVPIVAVTAKADNFSREECLDSGMNDFISKPYSTTEIFSCLNQFFN